MEAEHLYHWLVRFFKTNPKTTWENDELLHAIKEQYIDLLKRNQEDESCHSKAERTGIEHIACGLRKLRSFLRSSARTPSAHQEPALKLIDRTLDLARLKAISLGWLVALLEKTSSVCQIWLSRASQTIWKLKVSQHTALAIAAVALLMIAIAYFSLRQPSKETSGYANAPLSQPMLANSVLAVGPIELSRQHSETIVGWEQTLDSSKTEAKAITNLRLDEGKSKSTIQANPRTTGLKVAQAVETDASKTQKLAGKADQGIEYRIRRVAPLRQEPRYGAPKIQDIDAGATISVLGTKGDWLKVKTGPSGAVGYVRKEYVGPLTTSQ